MRISCNQLPERFDRRSARTCKLLLLGLALMISGCASSPPPARWYSQAEASSTIERLAGSSAPQGVVIYPYYEEAWSIQQPKEFMQSRYSCNKSTTLTGKSALKLTISGNFVEGELIKSDDCGDVTRESVRGRFNENYLFVQFGSAGTAIRRYKIADGGRMLLPEVNMTLSGTHTFPRNGQIMTESRNGKTYWTTEFVAAANGSQREQQLVEEARDGARAAKQARNESERADQRLAMALLQAPQASRPSGPSAAQRELAAIQERGRLASQRRSQVAQPTTQSQQTRLQQSAPAPVASRTQSAQQPTSAVVAQTMPRPQMPTAAPALPGLEQRKPEPSAPKLQPFPEAIVVCTIPNERGLFKCESPVNTRSGSPGSGIPEERTPEAMVASMREACRDAHPLASTTHRVWGCGFAATGIVGYYDRGGAGVHVEGRATYYCRDREMGCRRTEQP